MRTLLLAPAFLMATAAFAGMYDQPYALVERGDASETRKEARVAVTKVDGKSTRDPRITDPLAPGKYVITNQASVTIKQVAATATETQVADTNVSTTILAANSSRLGASVANDSSAVLYLRLSATAASATAYSVRLIQYAYFEVPYGYTGAITGIWASDPGDGAARVTEITA